MSAVATMSEPERAWVTRPLRAAPTVRSSETTTIRTPMAIRIAGQTQSKSSAGIHSRSRNHDPSRISTAPPMASPSRSSRPLRAARLAARRARRASRRVSGTGLPSGATWRPVAGQRRLGRRGRPPG